MTYTPEQQELLHKVERLQQEQNLSQNELCKRLGVSSAALSQIRNGKYNANPQKIFDTLANYFGVKERAKLTYSEVEYAPTSISSQIYDIIAVCQIKGGLAVAAGDAGIGKTKAAQKFVKDNPTNSIFITVTPCLSSVKSLLKVIANSIGASAERSKDELWFSITKKLTDGMVLIFDEAQHLTLNNIEVLRSFSDYFTSKGQTLGICFIGNLDTFAGIGTRKADFAQIANRTKIRMVFKTEQIQREDIKKLFPILDEEHMEKEIDLLHRIARTKQALRGTVNVFSNAYDNDDITYDGLMASAACTQTEV